MATMKLFLNILVLLVLASMTSAQFGGPYGMAFGMGYDMGYGTGLGRGYGMGRFHRHHFRPYGMFGMYYK
ncbi:unnamed protein product [Cylicocyclus nassatus]|uniref:Uncharacterized protein n=1 Tax=Cylicocyclus nassatus TaxID=53992 RepID=A0AA36DIY5_CYLNA|nr:unnamed protein product [Cylicocyclus nassatus]